jgi:GTP-binding protein HflX
MFERPGPDSGECALLVHLNLRNFTSHSTLEEFEALAHAAGVSVVAKVTGNRQVPQSAFFVGRGKLEEIKTLSQLQQTDVVLFNHTLTPGQERNLERVLECRVLDRTGVILDIFAQRARSFEGKLQVELAQLQYLSTRLIRGWTHLERQKGGIGLRGPGETQLETDRRLLAERIKYINKRLDKVSQQRELSRRARQRAEVPVVSLVGYTNAGKSTLFNCLTQANVHVADQLFATLDATLRRVELPDKTPCILADTVGFVQDLPHNLIAAFRATLEETRQATLLIHVVDASDPERQLRISQVNQVLAEIGVQDIPQIIVYNKIDRIEEIFSSEHEYDTEGHLTKIRLSAKTGMGVETLKTALMERLNKDNIQCWIRIPAKASRLRAQLFEIGVVLNEQFSDDGDSLLEVKMQRHKFNQLVTKEFMVASPVKNARS